MAYMLLIVEPPEQRQTRTRAEGEAAYAAMQRFGADLKEQGVLLATESLLSHRQAARVRVPGGQRQVIDGPFAEAKEMIGGFFLVDCGTQEEAVGIAARCPAAAWCTVEVRALGPCFED